MVSALDSGSGGPGSSPGRGTALCSWSRYFTLIVPLSTQMYKWVEILLVGSCYGNRDKLRPDGPLGSYADFTFTVDANLSSNNITPLNRIFNVPHLKVQIECSRRTFHPFISPFTSPLKWSIALVVKIEQHYFLRNHTPQVVIQSCL